jgi:hypothetical protein
MHSASLHNCGALFLDVLEVPEDEATGDVIKPTPFFPPCVQRYPSLLNHQRDRGLPTSTLRGMLTIFLVPHILTRLYTGHRFHARRTWCGTPVSIHRILYYYVKIAHILDRE